MRHAVIISAGFAEEDGDSAGVQEAIAALAKHSGIHQPDALRLGRSYPAIGRGDVAVAAP